MLFLPALVSFLLASLSHARQFTSSDPEHEMQRDQKTQNVITSETGWFRIQEASGLLDATVLLKFLDDSKETCQIAEPKLSNLYSGDFLTFLATPVVIRGNYEEGFNIVQTMTTNCEGVISEIKSEHHMLFRNGAKEYVNHRWTGYDHSEVGDCVFGISTHYIYDETIPKDNTRALEMLSKKLVLDHSGADSKTCQTVFTYDIRPGVSDRGENSCYCESIVPNDNLSDFNWSEHFLSFMLQPQLLVKKYVFISVLSILWLILKHFVFFKTKRKYAMQKEKSS